MLNSKSRYYNDVFEQTYVSYYNKVKYFTLQYLSDPEIANCVTQDVFVSFWVNIEKIDFSKSVLPYLLTSAKNKALNILSHEFYKKRYQNDLSLKYIHEINYSLLKDDTTSRILQKEIVEILSESFEEMHPNVKQTFLMCKVKGFKQKEVADLLGISQKTVEQRIKKAMMVIRKRFKDYLPFLFLFFEY